VEAAEALTLAEVTVVVTSVVVTSGAVILVAIA
jgi:hypothetical protein